MKSLFLWENQQIKLSLALRKCHACFIHKYMYAMHSLYKSVVVSWGRRLVVINKWKALPCVSGEESQSRLSWKNRYTMYRINIYMLKKLPDLVQSAVALVRCQTWDQCYIVQFNILAVVQGPRNDTTIQKCTKPSRSPPPDPSTWDTIQSVWGRSETLHLQKNVATACSRWTAWTLNTSHTWNIHCHPTVCL